MKKISLIELSDLLFQKTDMHKPNEIGGAEKTNLQMKCEDLLKDKLPHGGGFDALTEFNFFASNSDKIVFQTSFHHLNENGYYDGWTDHSVIFIPKFGGFKIEITGDDKNQIKDYIFDIFNEIFEL